jgi:hypothetical protein
MAKLKANKTSMYQMVKKYIAEVPPMRKTEFSKYRRTYWLEFRANGNYHRITLSVAGGLVYIRDQINRYDEDRQDNMYQPTDAELRELGMIEELTRSA